MTPTDVAALVTAIGGVLWPFIGLVLLWTLRKRFSAMVESIVQRGGGVKLGGFEISVAEATAQQQKLIADLQIRLAGIEDRLASVQPAPPTPVSAARPLATPWSDPFDTTITAPAPVEAIPGEASDVDLAEVAATRSIPAGTAILWVDGHPEAAAALIDTIEARGGRVTPVKSIAEALDAFAEKPFAVTIARMSIGGQSDAGVDLVHRITKLDPLATVYILAGARGADHHGRDALVAGAHFVTDSPAELIRQLTRLR